MVWDNFKRTSQSPELAASRGLTTWSSHRTPTNASRLNLIEPGFLVLEKTAFDNADLKTTEAIAGPLLQAIDDLIEHPRPYQWGKALGI